MNSEGFRQPLDIPQDLLLIQDLVTDHVQNLTTRLPQKPPAKQEEYDEIASSSSEAGEDDDNDSEDEVMNLVFKPITAASSSGRQSPISLDSFSESSSESSDSDSESEEDSGKLATIPGLNDDGEFDDEEPVASAKTMPKTAHELDDNDERILVPEHNFISSEEQLERVGEIMSVQHHSVIVRGIAATNSRISSPTALDIETLLVFEDRSVLGYIHDTFGPTAQPFYVVKFPSSHPPLTGGPAISGQLAEEEPTLGDHKADVKRASNPSRFTVERPVFHAPNRSRFVFVNELARQKGTDASNAHDEEPTGLEAMEFSDDEEEARWKRSLKGDKNTGDKRKRGESMPYSREQTPAQMYDQQMGNAAFDVDFQTMYGTNPYDADGVYDNDVASAEPSSGRRVVAYDDPYADNGPASLVQNETAASRNSSSPAHSMRPTASHKPPHAPSAGTDTFAQHGRGYGRGSSSQGMNNGRGRGRGHGGQQRGRGRGGGIGPRGGAHERKQQPMVDSTRSGEHSHLPSPVLSGRTSNGEQPTREMSPTSLAIARATGQYANGSSYEPDSAWQQGFEQPSASGNVQPHINPRFAAQWGMQIPSYWPNAYSQNQGQWSQWPDYYGGSDGGPYNQ